MKGMFPSWEWEHIDQISLAITPRINDKYFYFDKKNNHYLYPYYKYLILYVDANILKQVFQTQNFSL